MISCQKCGKEYKSSDSLRLHKRYCIEGIIFGCSLCPASFKSKHNQENHMKGTHEGGFSCSECSFTTKYNSSLSIHESIHHSGIVFPCPQCPFRATSKQTLKRHDKKQHEGIIFRCTECSHKASEKSKIKRHMTMIHHKSDCMDASCGHKSHGNINKTGTTNFPICPICKCNKSNIKRHIQRVHEGIRQPHTDGSCGHKSHDNIKKAEKIKCPICPICEKYFSFKSSLKNHIQ